MSRLDPRFELPAHYPKVYSGDVYQKAHEMMQAMDATLCGPGDDACDGADDRPYRCKAHREVLYGPDEPEEIAPEPEPLDLVCAEHCGHKDCNDALRAEGLPTYCKPSRRYGMAEACGYCRDQYDAEMCRRDDEREDR
jgi:hypothetical protein